MTGVAKNTVAKLLVDLGAACAKHHDKAVRGLKSRRVQCDEIWSFCYAKAKNVPKDKRGIFGTAMPGRGPASMPIQNSLRPISSVRVTRTPRMYS